MLCRNLENLTKGNILCNNSCIILQVIIMAIDLISMVPGVFATGLSLYNWLQTRKPANITPDQIIDYAIVSSSYDNADILTIPLVFYNSGAYNGIITDIKIGFKAGGKTKFLEIMGRANLSELTTDQMMNMAAEAYTKEGYTIVVPNYPINVLPGDTTSVVLIGVADHDENIIPTDVDAKWVVETHFGKNRVNKEEFDFRLSKENYEFAEYLRWNRS